MSMSMAERVCSRSSEYRDGDGRFQKSAFQDAVEGNGGVEVWNSNDGQSTISFAPTRHYEFRDGSKIKVTCSGAWVLDTY